MAHETDNRRIQASVWSLLETLCAVAPAVNVHWPDMGGADTKDISWIEPWLDIALKSGRANDWLYDMRLLINIFVKSTGLALYTVPELTGRLATGLKNVKFDIKSYELALPLVVGTGRFFEAETTDLGRMRAGAGFTDAGLRHAVVRCDGVIMPLGT